MFGLLLDSRLNFPVRNISLVFPNSSGPAIIFVDGVVHTVFGDESTPNVSSDDKGKVASQRV